MLLNTFHVSCCENCLAFLFFFVEENPNVVLDYILLWFSSHFSENFLSLPRLLFNRDDIVLALLAICSCTTGSFNSPVGC